MALQGTLDTFALADVLRLLAATKKTGRLRVTGDRGSGSVWVDEGRVVATDLSVTGASADDFAHTVFALLRFVAGSFTFESGATTAHRGQPEDVEPLLEQAELLLAEWRSIEAVVASLDSWLTLRLELDNDVVVDGPRWRVISAVAGGATAGAVGEALELGEIEMLRAAKELVELGLIEVGERPVNAIAPSAPSSSADAVTARHLPDRDPAPPSLAEMSSGLGSMHLAGEDDDADAVGTASPAAPSTAPFAAPTTAPFAVPSEAVSSEAVSSDGAEPASAPSFSAADLNPSDDFASDLAPPPVMATPTIPAPVGGGAEPSLDDAAEIARQLANLSPRAAKAVAAAAKATTEEEREAALAAIEAEDDTVNRGLLLRFLGSVDS